MKSKYSLEIMVGSKSIPIYSHEGNQYIEGRKGSEFSIRVRNTTNRKALFIVSVDGLSVTDGKPAGPDSIGFIVNAYGTYDIPGWVIDATNSAKFKFADKAKSYGGSSNVNSGVIGVMVFEELVKKPEKVYVDRYVYVQQPIPEPAPWKYPNNPIVWMSSNNTSFSAPQNNMLVGNARSVVLNETSVDEQLGVDWGSKTSANNKIEEFEKGEHKETLVLYYDTKKNLEKLGIVFDKKPREKVVPNPFPSFGCTPPKDWKG